jgi:hypothetical protein
MDVCTVASDEEHIRRCIPFAFGLKKNAAKVAQVISLLVSCSDWYEGDLTLKTEKAPANLKNLKMKNCSI